ncbi:MAG: MBL fold metallo-hydrolase [Clostridia bacterium]|nr:MBL fold metallo-hydrolase [Clostridia bacterium]
MALYQLTERVWVYPYEEARDRPNLGYIRGDSWSLAVDAGHSAAHTGEFYRALQAQGLPLPAVTVLTHWHWDHTFGMHAVHGLCLANARTNQHLADFRKQLEREGPASFFALDERIRREYAGGEPVIVTTADLTFSGSMRLDLGACDVRLMETEAPHTDDSTLVHVPGEKILFIGDAACGALPAWNKDPALCRKLAAAIEGTCAETVLEGHWTPQTRRESVDDLLSDAEG